MKDIPPDSTVVGVPGHVVVKKTVTENDANREAMAKKIGFDAYAERKDMSDPIQNALDSMLDHMHNTDEEMEALKKKVESIKNK